MGDDVSKWDQAWSSGSAVVEIASALLTEYVEPVDEQAAVAVSKDIDVSGNLMFVQSFVTLGILLN